jgi:hypothetical protein
MLFNYAQSDTHQEWERRQKMWNTFHPYLPLVPVYNTLHNSEPDTISFNVFECIYAAEQVENLY